MDLKLDFYNALCSPSKFIINNINADEDDFGEKYDRSPESAEPYCCGDMQFTRIPASDIILKKYNINLEEYNKICDKLEDGLSFGSCGWYS